MKLLNFEDIFAPLNAVKIELVPPGESCKPWSGYMCQWVEVQSPDGFGNGQQKRRTDCCLRDLEKRRDSHGSDEEDRAMQWPLAFDWSRV